MTAVKYVLGRKFQIWNMSKENNAICDIPYYLYRSKNGQRD